MDWPDATLEIEDREPVEDLCIEAYRIRPSNDINLGWTSRNATRETPEAPFLPGCLQRALAASGIRSAAGWAAIGVYFGEPLDRSFHHRSIDFVDGVNMADPL